MACAVLIAANQLQGAKTGLFSRVQLFMNIREEQDLRRRYADLRRNVLIRLNVALGADAGIKIAAEQMSNITFVAVAK
ncbi:hypothetical protein D3C80_930970 [compost metagenome]